MSRKWSCGLLREKEKKEIGWACWARMKEWDLVLLFFSSFLFNPLLKNLFKFSNMMHNHLGIF
jgi:succinate dehydrogenase flavin-adding protein (antitoxin of CptAB toxin-antitoxin module)